MQKENTMCWVKCTNISTGLADHEKVAKFSSVEGDTVEVAVYKAFVNEADRLLKAELITRRPDAVLIELPTESARGDWRAWVSSELVQG